jgi:hypothetical protein
MISNPDPQTVTDMNIIMIVMLNRLRIILLKFFVQILS